MVEHSTGTHWTWTDEIVAGDDTVFHDVFCNADKCDKAGHIK